MLDSESHGAHGNADVLAAMTSHKNEMPPVFGNAGGKVRILGVMGHPLQGIDHGVSRNEDRFIGNVLGAKEGCCKFRGGKVPVGKTA